MKKGKTCSEFLSQYLHIHVYICRKKRTKIILLTTGEELITLLPLEKYNHRQTSNNKYCCHCKVLQQGCKNYQHFIQKDKISPLAKAGESCSVFHGLDLTAVVTTPKMMANTVKPWAKMRPLIKSCDCLVFPWWKARRPYISAPAVAKQPGGGETETRIAGDSTHRNEKGQRRFKVSSSSVSPN